MRALMIGGLIISSAAMAAPDKKARTDGETRPGDDRVISSERLSIVVNSDTKGEPETPPTVKNSKQRLMEAYDAGDEKFQPEDEPDQ